MIVLTDVEVCVYSISFSVKINLSFFFLGGGGGTYIFPSNATIRNVPQHILITSLFREKPRSRDFGVSHTSSRFICDSSNYLC